MCCKTSNLFCSFVLLELTVNDGVMNTECATCEECWQQWRLFSIVQLTVSPSHHVASKVPADHIHIHSHIHTQLLSTYNNVDYHHITDGSCLSVCPSSPLAHSVLQNFMASPGLLNFRPGPFCLTKFLAGLGQQVAGPWTGLVTHLCQGGYVSVAVW